MAELYQQERLQPSLLDRLTDDSAKTGERRYRPINAPQAQQLAITPNDETVSSNSAAGTVQEEPEGLPLQTPSSSSSTDASRKGYRQQDSIDRFVISSSKLRQYIKRDLGWLLNTSSLDSVVDLSNYPFIAQSVLNYGIPELTGLSVRGANTMELERSLKKIIIQYEPRILKNTLSIHVTKSDDMSINALTLSIECDIWGQPAPEHLYLTTRVDLDTGEIVFHDRRDA